MNYRCFSAFVAVLSIYPCQLRAAPPLPPAPIPGTLVLAGGGSLPDAARDEFFKLAGGKDKARIIVIPTGRGQDNYEGSDDEILQPWKSLGPASVEVLHTRDSKTANNPKFVEPLTRATAVWFTNGHTDRLLTAYSGTLVAIELRKLLERGGVVGGIDAGAVVLADRVIQRFDPDTVSSGFGLLPGVVMARSFGDPESDDRSVLGRHPGYYGLGIAKGTAAIVRGRQLRVVGDGTVTVFWSKSPTKAERTEVLKAGGVLDLFQAGRAAAFRAMTPQFPPAEPAAPVVQKGSLVIVGGGGVSAEIMNRFFHLAGGKNSLVVVIPTASEREIVPADPNDAKILRNWGGTNIHVLHTRDRKVADDPEFSKVLTQAKGVWFGGGRQWRFVDSFEQTLTERRIREVLDRGGVIGGSSAGASIQSEFMPRGHPLGNRVMAAEGYERGFGYLPGCAVDQHFFARNRVADMSGLMKLYPQLLGIGIDEGTAIVVQGSIAEVVGKSKVGFFDRRTGPPDGEKDYVEVPAGGKYDLKSRKVAK